MKKIFVLILASVLALPVLAQYPEVPDSVVARAARQSAEWQKFSDEAWQKALPIIEQEEKEFGRIYRPWASKPEQLLKASIPAFPGAEGGGMYTPGGRGGKVFDLLRLE